MTSFTVLTCKSKKILTLLPVLLWLYFPLIYAQNEQPIIQNNNLTPGISLQIYPAGIITTFNTDMHIAESSSLIFRLGGNFADRKDFSKFHDSEKGSGFGGSFGFRRNFKLRKGEIIAGLNSDLWNLWINWKDEGGFIGEIRGRTYTLVLQPWFETGYFTRAIKSPIQFGISVGFGREINIITKGEEVAQGWILSASLHVSHLFKI